MEKATLAGGCFWCIEEAFADLWGVERTRCGYSGGTTTDPTYKNMGDHSESVEILFDPAKITFPQLLDLYWRQIDPLDSGGQFFDRGSHYQTVIFTHDAEQKRQAEASKAAIASYFSEPIATQIRQAGPFYEAEKEHQNYFCTQKTRFEAYKRGHEEPLRHLWLDKPPIDLPLQEKLTPLQYRVTQEEGTEPPFDNAYHDNKKKGVYVDLISGVPLFSSADKFDSGTGWPSFTQPISPDVIKEVEGSRVEVRSASSDAHLGHVFPDGPPPTHLRYCINSAALRFIPQN